MVFNNNKLLLVISLVISSIFLMSCTFSEQKATPYCPPCAQEILTEQSTYAYSPFNMSFAEEHKTLYLDFKKLLTGVNNDVCVEEFVERYGEETRNHFLCTIKETEQIQYAGRDGNDEQWQWRVVCYCSYDSSLNMTQTQ